jgi:flagellar basal-body rod protein FlgF
MDRLIYTSAIGAAQVERAQAVHANNLANVSTTGFQADFAQAQSRWIEGDGLPARIYGMTDVPGTDFQPGVLQQTARDLDVAVSGSGFLTLQLPGDNEAYTRAGNLQVDSSGRLVSAEGLPVMGDGGPIALPPYERLYIGADGSITVQPEGQGPDTQVQVGRLKLVNPDPAELVKGATGLLHRRDGGQEAAAQEVEVVSGFLETSNVSAVGEMTEILALARQYEIEVRMMRTAEENDRAASELLRIG